MTGWHSVALPVPLTDLVPGAQQIALSGNQPMAVANVNIVLIAAAAVPKSPIRRSFSGGGRPALRLTPDHGLGRVIAVM